MKRERKREREHEGWRLDLHEISTKRWVGLRVEGEIAKGE
jgi:hypothetical protein